MKNIYRQLGFDQIVDECQIKEALLSSQISPRTRRAAEEILLNPRRKLLYDKHWRTLSQIGQLRANLGLTLAACWIQSGCSEFDTEPTCCGSELDQLKEYMKSAPSERRTAFRAFSGCLPMLYGAILVVGALVMISLLDSRHEDQDTSGGPDRPVFMEPAAPLPRTGVLSRSFYGSPLPTLTIVTPIAKGHFFVKVVDWTTKQEIITLFVRGGDRVTTRIPAGSYELRYASGSTWYGTSHLFGPDTVYYRALKQFVFEETMTEYTVYTVELILQPFGNLRTQRIRQDEF